MLDYEYRSGRDLSDQLINAALKRITGEHIKAIPQIEYNKPLCCRIQNEKEQKLAKLELLLFFQPYLTDATAERDYFALRKGELSDAQHDASITNYIQQYSNNLNTITKTYKQRTGYSLQTNLSTLERKSEEQLQQEEA
jgi:hypothetical protein